MPETIADNNVTQIIGGTFSNRDNADRALEAFRQLGVPEQNLQVVVQLDERQADRAYSEALTARGVSGIAGSFLRQGRAPRKDPGGGS